MASIHITGLAFPNGLPMREDIQYDRYYARGAQRLCIHCDKWFTCTDKEPWVSCGCQANKKRRDDDE